MASSTCASNGGWFPIPRDWLEWTTTTNRWSTHFGNHQTFSQVYHCEILEVNGNKIVSDSPPDPKIPRKLVILYGMWEGVQDHIVKEFIRSFKITKPIKQNRFLQHKLRKEAIFFWEMHDSRVPFVRHSIKLLMKGGSLRPHRCRMGRNVWFLCWKLHVLGDQKWHVKGHQHRRI